MFVSGLLCASTVCAQEQETESAPARALDSRGLRALYLDLVARPPFAQEREAWLGRGFEELVEELLGSPEYWSNWHEDQLYYFLLVDNFRPTSERVLASPVDLERGRIGVREALHRIATCASFDRRNPGPDTFVTVVMEQLLGATVQKRVRDLDIGKRVYDGHAGNFLGRKGESQADVVRIAVEDREALRHFLAREYRRLLRDEPGKRELARWVRALEGDELAYPDLVADWMVSDAYRARLESFEELSNRSFVRALFVDLTDRLPEEDEARRMRNALDGLADTGPLRSVLARLLIDSGTTDVPARAQVEDPTRWIQGLFQRLLGRSASAAELEAFVLAFRDPACRPETVVYAIVSHPEYPTW